ncbi:cyclophilin seven suppressor, putative [Entamoeba invadens IP1]|uniref:Cyclophilin seven suppressor, putative n=1 Tax=Entamoeba invadens IP1 TaxID=370355 RepID=L7FKR8_ENTIV|nr:cyclophilin seven suppressor, putative [Entamoeba invadens IP1]ELP84899.1 cyclophilin seven suppressor, putative [Entamoeba invadens IP1]|eukprot:XP_004184245.1 cyclophilin seven suppressor, putative [Entamoeba invadens IP1]
MSNTSAQPAESKPVEKKTDEIPWEEDPFFATEMPEGGNAMFDALAALKYEGTPDEQATNFRDHGNELFQVGRYKDAAICYTDGIQAKPTDIALFGALYANRAACQLKLENYGRAYEDASESLKLVPNNIKCYYRMATAKTRLHQYDEALVCIDLGLNLNKTNADLLKLRTFCVEMKKRTAVEKPQPKNYENFLAKKGITQKKFDLMNDMSVYMPLYINYDKQSGFLKFPLIVLYPQDDQSDCLRDCSSDTLLRDILYTLMEDGLPWDKKKRYNPETCVVCVQQKDSEEQVIVPKEAKMFNLLKNYGVLFKTAAFVYVFPKN